MSGDDYLWKKEGPVDLEVARLERLLGKYRYSPRKSRFVPFAAAAAILLLVAVSIFAVRGGGLEVETAQGKIRLTVGGTLETGAAPARIALERIGRVDVEPRSRIRLLTLARREQRLALDRGRIHVIVTAPPRIFVVDTPAATAVDLGCEYSLAVDESGGGVLEVAKGQVELDAEGGFAIVIAGFTARSRPGELPGIPVRGDAPEPVRALARGGLVPAAIAAAREEDSVTLWHLLFRVGESDRRAVYARLLALSPERAASEAEAMALDRTRLDAWFEELPSGDDE